MMELYVNRLDIAANMLKAIAHPMRIAIIELLDDKNRELNVTQIYTKLKIEQATASHHLNILRNQGIISFRRDGKQIFYFIKTEALATLVECINKCGDK